MTEKEYCISKFEENFAHLKNKNIALYGTGINAQAIINSFPEYKITCLVDDKAAGKYVAGKYVVTFSQMLELGIDTLILAAQTSSAEIVFARIGEQCKACGIQVFNMYGKDMYKLHESILPKKVSYANLKEGDLEGAITAHDVVSFNLVPTLFTPIKTDIFDFYQEIEKELIAAGVGIDYLADKLISMRSNNPNATLKEAVEQAAANEGLQEECYPTIWEIVYKKITETFLPRKAVLKAVQFALESGKKVCFVEDFPQYGISQVLWERLLADSGVKGYAGIFCGSEGAENKYNGLYRQMMEQCGDGSYLHVGSDCEADILVPQLYGMETFLVKSARELFDETDSLVLDKTNVKNVRMLFEEYLAAVYNDEYRIDAVKQKWHQEILVREHLERRISFYRTCNEVSGGAPMEFEPKLFGWFADWGTVDQYEKFTFPVYEEPEVSIVIPVYNQFGYTYNCLKSIHAHTEDVTYEVIIADDCSTDNTKYLEEVFPGVQVLHNEENLKFLLNCNHAAQYAKGKYILFLNNDTQVQPNWLKPMVDLMEQNAEAGMVGSKLVYSDGSLQEAGGILWKDGSAWNYGHLQNPDAPEFSYVKEADYISGASIMIRASLWKEIGGFDTAFAPAYYEDTDLAFEVRKHGYKVLFQPKSVVVHFEGKSNGTDTSTGLKSYQVINQKKFFQKWKDVLGSGHFENGQEVYLAKDRGQTKKQILVIDHYVPNYDKDAGGRCTFMYMKAFLNMGMKVTFLGDNFAKPEPYTTILNQMGIEVLYGDYYCLHWQEWMKENLKHFDYVYLQRPHISIKYMDVVKEYSRAKILYFAHDLHHVRLYRDYQITGNKKSLEDSEYWKKVEMELFEKTDVGHVVGSYEQEIMQQAFPDKPIRNIPLYIYEEMPERIEKDFSKRQDILFVGGFSHLPNVDAVLWFAKEIFPKLLEKYPNLVWHVVGSRAPKEVLELASENIILEGFVSDEDLGELYRKCRMVVVPLRYGAGVKGKIVESAYYQIPIVTTSIGGEGIDETVGAFVMEDDADKMADLIAELYSDFDRLKEMSDAGMELTQKYFTSEAAERVLRMDMNIR